MITIEETICRGYCHNYKELEEYQKILQKSGRINCMNITFTDNTFFQPIQFELSYTPYKNIEI